MKYVKQLITKFFDKWSATITTISILLASLSYLSWTRYLVDLFQPDFEVLSLSTRSLITVSNISESDLYFSALRIEPTDDSKSITLDVESPLISLYGVDLVVQSNSIGSEVFFKDYTHHAPAQSSYKPESRLFDLAYSEDTCVFFAYFHKNSPQYRSYSEDDLSRMSTDSFKGTIEYYRLGSNKLLTQEIDLYGVISVTYRSDCIEAHRSLYRKIPPIREVLLPRDQ